jgi:hypothetical protein
MVNLYEDIVNVSLDMVHESHGMVKIHNNMVNVHDSMLSVSRHDYTSLPMHDKRELELVMDMEQDMVISKLCTCKLRTRHSSFIIHVFYFTENKAASGKDCDDTSNNQHCSLKSVEHNFQYGMPSSTRVVSSFEFRHAFNTQFVFMLFM